MKSSQFFSPLANLTAAMHSKASQGFVLASMHSGSHMEEFANHVNTLDLEAAQTLLKKKEDVLRRLQTLRGQAAGLGLGFDEHNDHEYRQHRYNETENEMFLVQMRIENLLEEQAAEEEADLALQLDMELEELEPLSDLEPTEFDAKSRAVTTASSLKK